MHPSGGQLGLSRGLLQRRGEEILLSDQLLETISRQAQMHVQLGRPAIRGNFLVDITVRGAGRVRKSLSRPPRRDCSLLREFEPDDVLHALRRRGTGGIGAQIAATAPHQSRFLER